jgi:hypothetical protein
MKGARNAEQRPERGCTLKRAFLLAHGVQVTVMWKMRGALDPQQSLTLFDALPSLLLIRLTLGIVVGSGLIAGFIEPWWQQWWMWLSLALLVAIWAAMWRWGGGYFGLIQETATRALEERARGPGSTVAMEAFERTRKRWQPVGMMLVGIGGLAVILWLMMFKPF